jgi:polyphosphate kinase 2 (PPK2 family)
VLEDLDLKQAMDPRRYRQLFPALKERLRQIQYELRDAEIPTIVVFEGWGASGKGDVFQKLTEGLDPRVFRAYPETAPTELEQRHHWLWRYQVRLPEDGYMTLFDHAWYHHVLGERVGKKVSKKDCRRAYEQINQFERWLTDDGQILVKIFFHIRRGEQKRRLRKMEEEPLESWKVDADDWRQNRRYERWVKAIEDMLAHTDTRNAPWTLVSATDARWARAKAFETILDRMTEAMARRQKTPEAVSRTRLAARAAGGRRAQERDAALTRARTTAAEAGLPLEGPSAESRGNGAPGGNGEAGGSAK